MSPWRRGSWVFLVLSACSGGGAIPPSTQPSALLAIEIVGRPGRVVSTLGGEEVRIVGSGLDPTSPVRFDDQAAAAVRAEGPDALIATTPPMPAGVVDLTVGAATLFDALEFQPPPSVTAIVALGGPTAGEPRASVDGDTLMEVRGRDFRPPMTVFVGGRAAGVAHEDAGIVRFLAPAVAGEGVAEVEVRNEDGLFALAALTYTQEFSLAPAADPLDAARAHHLYRRAGFGAAPEEIELAVADGVTRTVARLLAIVPVPAVEAAAAAVYDHAPPREPVNRRANQEWWLHLLLNNPNVLQERMAFLWHDHFATNQKGFNDATWFMFDQIQLFRRLALGNWRELCDGVTRDFAMLLWLDGVYSTRDNPNENFARELWELFMLGEGVGYTQADIVAASRAFTGFRLQHNPDHFVTVIYLPELHDAGPKTVFGVTGQFGYGGVDTRDSDGSIVDLTLGQRPLAASRFLCRKLAAHFLYDDPPDVVVEQLASQLRAGGWEMAPVVERLLMSKAFFSARAMRAQLKSPLEFVIGFLRGIGIDMPVHRVNQRLIDLGQSLLEPPTVAGWPGAGAFTGAQSMLFRINFLNEAVSHLHDPGPYLPSEPTPEARIDHIADRLGVALGPVAREEMLAYLSRGLDEPLRKTRGLAYMIGQYHAGYLK
ncbi:MAG: DUF1800 family protein [Planctomycetota bacterium]|jgi:uncharacterized protein (DUF1800 family)